MHVRLEKRSRWEDYSLKVPGPVEDLDIVEAEKDELMDVEPPGLGSDEEWVIPSGIEEHIDQDPFIPYLAR